MKLIETDLLQGIDTIIIRTANYNVSKSWYQEKLGLTIIWDEPAMKLAVLDTKSPVSLTLWQTDKKIMVERDTVSYPIFRTKDAAALREELGKRNVETGDLIQDDYVKYFFFYDPDGNPLEACETHV